MFRLQLLFALNNYKVFIYSLFLCFFATLLPLTNASQSTSSADYTRNNKEVRIEEYLIDSLPNVRLLPDNFFYFIKTLWEKFQLLVAFNPVKKAKLYLEFSEMRLSEALNLANVRQVHISEKLIHLYDDLIDKANAAFEVANRSGLDVSELATSLTDTVNKREIVVNKIGEQVSQDALNAKERTTRMMRESSPSSITVEEVQIKVYDASEEEVFISPVGE